MVNCSSRSVTRAWDCQRRRWIKSFLRSLPPSRRGAAWGWPSAVPLWSRMAASCGQPPTVEWAQLFISTYRSRSPSHRRWLPKSSVTLESQQQGIRNTEDCAVHLAFGGLGVEGLGKHLPDFCCFLGSQIFNRAEIKLMHERVGFLENLLQRIELV